VIGCKNDLVDARAVTREEAQTFAVTVGARYAEASSVTGDGVEEIFTSASSSMVAAVRSGWRPEDYRDQPNVDTFGGVRWRNVSRKFGTRSIGRGVTRRARV